MSNLTPTPITDKNGVQTTRNKKTADTSASDKRVKNASVPPSKPALSKGHAQLLNELDKMSQLGVSSILIHAYPEYETTNDLTDPPFLHELYEKSDYGITDSQSRIDNTSRLGGNMNAVRKALESISSLDDFGKMGLECYEVDDGEYFVDLTGLKNQA